MPRTRIAQRAAAGELPTRDEVVALIDEHGLGEHRERILAVVRAGYALVPGDGSVRYGGLPDLAAGEAWPHREDGTPYAFLAQIDCARLPALGDAFPATEWRHDGRLLRVFTPFGVRVPEPAAAVTLSCAPDAPLIRAEAAPGPSPMPADAGEGDRSLPVRSFSVRPMLSVPAPWCVLPDGADVELEDRFWALREDLGAVTWTISRMLGAEEPLRADDPRRNGGAVFPDAFELQSLTAWRQLVHFAGAWDDDEGPGSALAIIAPAADLAAGRHDRLVVEPE